MKKEKADLEQLLNSLIEKGWKPFGIEGIVKVDMSREHYGIDFENSKGYALASEVSPRQLTSKESGLWQFVCENGMVEKNKWIGRFKEHLDTRDGETKEDWEFDVGCAEYYIIESSLKEESELEDFLLQNIKIDDAND